MLDTEASIRDQINNDRDCMETALRQMGLRQELTALVGEWSLFGGGERVPTILQERLSENRRAVQKRKILPKQKGEKRPPARG